MTIWMAGVLVMAGTALNLRAQLPVGERSDDVSFSLFESDTTLATARLSDYTGKVVALVYFTPW